MRDFLETIGGILLGILAVLMISAAIKYCVDEGIKSEQQIHDCYIQEPKTKECEYILWREELRASKNKNQDDDFVTGMLLGQAMSGGLK